MKTTRTTASLIVIGLCAGAALTSPDLICSSIDSATSFGVVDGKSAYSFGTTLCNVSDVEISWDATSNKHPVISQTLYRLDNGQIQQIGIGFVRHTTIPLASNACNLGCTPAGFNALGAGCSTASSSATNGSQGLMGPRTEINAFTGDFPSPFTSINQVGNAIYKRLQVDLDDISNPNALYFIETQVITSDETDPSARDNNASYRQVLFAPGTANASLVGPTYPEQPAIFAMRDHANGIGMPDLAVLITPKHIPDDGLIHIGSRATPLDDDTWRYDYAVHDQNTERGIESILIPIGFNRLVTDRTFSDVDYHDDLDELIDPTDWAQGPNNGEVQWHTVETYESNPLGNAIRWGTAYSFSFVSPYGPVNKAMQVEFFAPGATDGPDTMTVGIIGPRSGDCPADIDGDGALNFFDISAFLSSFSAMNLNADFTGDGELNFFDISAFLSAFSAGCP